MYIDDFEKLISNFDTIASESKYVILEMLEIISEGKAPLKSDIEKFNDKMNNLNTAYSLVIDASKELLSEDEMPSSNASVVEYANAVKNNAKIALQKKIEQAKQVISDFLRVKSLVESYAVEIIPYQEKARKILSELPEYDATMFESAIADIKPTELFLNTLKCEDLDSDEGIALLEEVSEFFPRRVQIGLQGNKYFIAENEPAVTQTISNKAQEDHVETSNTETTSNDQDNSATLVLETTSDNVTDPNNDVNDEHVDDSNVEITLDIEENKDTTFINSTKTIKNSTPNASNFKKELISLPPNARAILPLFTNLAIMTAKQVQLIGMCMDCFDNTESTFESVQSTLTSLTNKGLLAAYDLGKKTGLVYCLTSYCYACLKKETIAKLHSPKSGRYFWDISLGEYRICGTNEMPRLVLETAIEEVDALLTYACDIKDHISAKDYVKIKGSILHVEGGYRVGAFVDEDFVLCIAASARAKENENYPLLFVEQIPDIFTDSTNVYLYQNGRVCVGTSNIIKSDKNIENVNDSAKDADTTTNEAANTFSMEEQDVGEGSDATNKEVEKFVSFEVDEVDTLSAELLQKEDEKSFEQVADDDEFIHIECMQNNYDEVPSDVKDFVYTTIIDEKIYCASAYAKAAAIRDTAMEGFYARLAYAVGDPLHHCEYSANNIFALMNDMQNDFDSSAIVAASLRTFFSNQIRYDFNLKSLYDGIKDNPILRACSPLSMAMYSLSEFKSTHKKGMDAYADYRLKNIQRIEQIHRQLVREAEEFYNNYILGKKKETASFERYIRLKQLIFAQNGEIGEYIKAIIDGQDDLQELAMTFLRENFFADDSLSEDTINPVKIWEYVKDNFWEKSQEGMLSKKNVELMGSLRNNIISTTKKAVQLIVRWCDLVERKNVSAQDKGATAYKSVRKKLCENLENAIDELDKLAEVFQTKEQIAGILLVKNTAKEVLDCVMGDYDENKRRFFYTPFLLSGDVTLTNEYLPDMDIHGANIVDLMPQSRIHRFSQIKKLPNYRERIDSIIEDTDDNYGTASLLVDYYSIMNPDADMSSQREILSLGVEYAQKDAIRKKDDFAGELEFSQANGQIDNSTEDIKEGILQVVNNWYEWAQETGNYGVFDNVLQSYLSQIRKKAKEREAVLLGQLDEIRKSTGDSFSLETKNRKIDKIKAMITEQKYTAAEDLLNRFHEQDEGTGSFFAKDFLVDFLDNYDIYRDPVASHQYGFAACATKRGYNKETRGAVDLAQNWLPGGGDLGGEKLKKLLTLLGFKVRKIDVQPRISIGKSSLENYFIYTETIRDYSHPIAAFGTGAATDGFRIVCLTGVYKADQLINIMKRIGNAKHTLLLLDDALSLAERRKLARKSKNELGDKFIGVIDRVVMMYLVRNFDQTHNNQTLISIIAPFGYYQPYIWNSADPIPPEMFIGRKYELENIKSRNGVNIVYGGRQLGKSALLKKAKDDVDHDENGSRAIYIDIKFKTYAEVAQEISHALYDCNILTEDINTTDWNELARHIKRRLQSDKDPIPYLLLLLDEADSFIESSETIKYTPFDALKDIQGTGKFKFVVAGLHNVVRFKREAALGGNSVLTHLGAMTVKPFSLSEARELLEVPLHYLGLRFPEGKNSEFLIPTILSSTNYFPGLIQMYCAKLLLAMRATSFRVYDEATSPTYEVSAEHIKKILSDVEFTNEIREKFEITLGVDEDKYYDVIALIMAYLYHENGDRRGYDASDIKNTGKELGISKISEMSIDKLNAFLEELKELNIFRSTDSTHYLFTRLNFYQMMGSRSEVEDKLFAYMEE